MIKRIVNVQEKLLRKAINLVNSGGEIIYSTCSILKDENQEILEKFKNLIEIEPIYISEIENFVRILNNESGTLTICPNEYFEGFFVAKIIKK